MWKEPDTGATACKEHWFPWHSKQAACAGMVVAAYSHAETDPDTLPPKESRSGLGDEHRATCGIRHFSVEGSDLV